MMTPEQNQAMNMGEPMTQVIYFKLDDSPFLPINVPLIFFSGDAKDEPLPHNDNAGAEPGCEHGRATGSDAPLR